jgi:hypothetical protein
MSVAHVRYREGQVLRAADLRAEQQERLQGWWRHTRSQHGWGITHGLWLSVDASGLPAGICLVVAPGLATDRWGRVLVLSAEQLFSCQALENVAPQPEHCVGVWLWPTAASVPCTTRAPRGERYEACIVLAAPGAGGPGSPLPPYEEIPEAALPQPVYLGGVKRCDGQWAVLSNAGRALYVGLVGAAVYAPDGKIAMHLGRERLEDFTRFAIRTLHDPQAPIEAGATGEAPAAPAAVDRISINAAGRITLRGPVEIVPPAPAGAEPAPIANTRTAAAHCCDPCSTLEDCKTGIEADAKESATDAAELASGTADLIVDNVCATRPRGVHFAPALPLPAQPRPWRIYHTREDQGEQPGDRFRIELPDLGGRGNPDAIQLAIGHSDVCADEGDCGCGGEPPPQQDASAQRMSDDCCFTECLTITADCALRIPPCRCLVVHGRIRESPVSPDPNDPRFTAAQMAALLQALFDAFLLTVPQSEATPR